MNAPAPTTRDVLTQEEAATRAARVSEADYQIALDLKPKAEAYIGDVTVTFRLADAAPVFLDFTGNRIDRLEVNGTLIGQPDWTGFRLTLSHGLVAGQNTVRVAYENDYDHTGEGFHQFVDPEDGEEYLYTNFEPYASHRLFPQFDQPDIKGRYTLAVSAPRAWKLIANSAEDAVEDLPDGRLRTTFARTRSFSTYLFALIAGPFEVFRGQWQDVPLGFYSRKSLAPYIDQDELFEITEQGMEFYAGFFDYPYPFQKYDQIFVPEFNAGAMENVGAVTHSERLVFRDPPTENDRLNRAEVILHELAHMWFGNLVTMRWWNGLWLNESFATYMSYLALAEATRFKSAWQTFNSGMKNWAYREDQLVTTHPISGVVGDTDETFLNFDGITYGKGAAVIKQLVAAIGMDGFRRGMRRYFKQHEYGNTTIAEWLDALGAGADRDLHPWADVWLGKASLNTIAATVERDGERIASLRLEQSASPEHPTLRPHTLEVALVRRQGGGIVVDSVPATIDGADTEVRAAVGRPAPDLTFPNHNDHGFVKVALDAPSVEFLREHLEEIQDPLLRMLIWQTLWNMVRDQQLKSTDFLALAGPKVARERDHELVETILSQMAGAISRFVPEEQKATEAHRFFQLCAATLGEVSDPDLKIIWARTLVGVAINPDDIVHTGRLADGAITIPGLSIDQDMRWTIASHFVAYGIDGGWARAEAERERDRSDRGQRAFLRCQVSRPDADVKQDAWERFHDGKGFGSLHMTAAGMSGFNWWSQGDLLAPYTEQFFAALPGVFEREDNEYASRYVSALWPGFRVERDVLARSEAVLASMGDRLPTLQRKLRETNDDLLRAIRCREFASA
ncbi:MAG: aminopeptidase N [Chloroflexi bacterium]|nr:aminopeptidase N [Chloroflexota bacterium]MDA1241126.1 aminopeptidase N [Chloroflexota bacterium]